VVDRKTVQIADLAAESDAEYPEGKAVQRLLGHRTALATPLLRDGMPLGAILIQRMEVMPFTDKQVRLLETFANQAVIAINNVGLFEEVQSRTRELQESLEYQRRSARCSRSFRDHRTNYSLSSMPSLEVRAVCARVSMPLSLAARAICCISSLSTTNDRVLASKLRVPGRAHWTGIYRLPPVPSWTGPSSMLPKSRQRT
jgi:hypothetical protein